MSYLFAPATERFTFIFDRELRERIPVPLLPATIHVALVNRLPQGGEAFIAGKYQEWYALCGQRVKTVLPSRWSDDMSGACEKCVDRYRLIGHSGAPRGLAYETNIM